MRKLCLPVLLVQPRKVSATGWWLPDVVWHANTHVPQQARELGLTYGINIWLRKRKTWKRQNIFGERYKNMVMTETSYEIALAMEAKWLIILT